MVGQTMSKDAQEDKDLQGDRDLAAGKRFSPPKQVNEHVEGLRAHPSLDKRSFFNIR